MHSAATATVIQATDGALNVGANTIKVVVRAVDGSTETYTVMVTRAGSDATLTVVVPDRRRASRAGPPYSLTDCRPHGVRVHGHRG